MNEEKKDSPKLPFLQMEEETLSPFSVDSLPRELREQLANEIKSLPEMQAGGARGAGKALPPRDAERIVGMLQQTLRDAQSRGGFFSDLPRREARIQRLRERIQAAKEELSALCEQILARQRTLRWLGGETDDQGDVQPHSPRIRGMEPADPDRSLQLEQIQTEIKNLRAQTRRVSADLTARIHELAEEIRRCERIKTAATGRTGPAPSGDSRHTSHDRRGVRSSPMVYRRKKPGSL